MTKYYEKDLPRTCKHRPPLQMVDYLVLKEENKYFSKMMDLNADAYERLIEEIVSGDDFCIEGKFYRCIELTKEEPIDINKTMRELKKYF